MKTSSQDVLITKNGLYTNDNQQENDITSVTAETADSNVKNINAPDYLSPLEKLQLKVQMDNFATIYAADKDIATSEGINFTAYDAAYHSYLAYMTPLIADMTTYSPIVRSTFNGMVAAVQVKQKQFSTATQAQYNQQIKQAQTDIDDGQTKYEALQSEAKIMESSVAGISDAADRAISSAGFASDAASTASQAASTASQAASSALASATNAESSASSAVSTANSTASEFGPVKQSADSALIAASSAVSIANSTASGFGKVGQKADSAFANAMSAQSYASSAVSQASSAAADSKDAKQIAGAVSQSYKTLTDGSTMTVAELESGLAVKLTKADLNGYATQDWAQNQIKLTADGINGTLSKKIEKTDLNGYATEDWTQNQIKITAEGIQSTVSDKVSSDQLTQLSNQLTNKISDLSSSTSSQFTQTGKDINGLVKKGDVVNQFNLDAGGYLLSTSGDSTKIVFSSPNIIFDSNNPVQIPNANIPGTLTGKTFEAGTITATTKIKGSDIEAPLIHSPNGSFKLDGNTGDIIGASIHSADNSWGISKDGNIHGATINAPTLDLGTNGTFTESYDYTQPTGWFLPKKATGSVTFDHGVIEDQGTMQSYVNGTWGAINDSSVFTAGLTNNVWTEYAPGYYKIDMYKQGSTTEVLQRTYADPTGYYYSLEGNGVTSYLGNVLSTPQVQTGGVLAKYIGPGKGVLRLQIAQNGKDYGLQVGSYAGKEAVLSDFIYGYTTSGSPNVHIDMYGRLARTTSASKYKYNIKNPDIEDTLGDRLLNVHLATWNDKRAVDSYAEQLNTGEEREKSSIDKYYGLIAEQLRDAGLDMFISYGKNHEIEGIQYDRAWVPLLSVIRRLNDKVNEYELRLSKLEGKTNG